MGLPAKDIMDLVASLQNDTARSMYSYTAQLPYLNMAIIELRELMELNNVPVTNETDSSIVVAAGDTVIPNEDLPLGLVEIRQISERPSGTSQQFMGMHKVEFLPDWDNVQTTSLIYWAWINQEIRFVGSTTDTQILLKYIKHRIPKIVDPSDEIEVINAQGFLMYRSAGLCSQFIGENESRAEGQNTMAALSLDRMLGINAKGKQSIYTRRRPFRLSFKRGSNF